MWDLDASRLTLPADAARWEYGTLHFGAALGLAAAVEELNDYPGGADGVWAHSRSLAGVVARGAERLGLRVISPLAEAERSAIVALRLPEGVDAPAVAKALLEEHSLLVSSRAGMLRVSPHIANDEADVERLLSALRLLLPFS